MKDVEIQNKECHPEQKMPGSKTKKCASWARKNKLLLLFIILFSIFFILAIVMTTLYALLPPKHELKPLPEKTLYAFWGQGEHNMKPLERLFVDNMRKNIPSDMTLVIVTQDNYRNFIDPEDLPKQETLDKFVAEKAFATLKDAILFSIISKNGGIATDISNILYKDRVEKMWKEFKENDYDSFLYTYDNEGWDKHHNEKTAVWWIMMKKGSKLGAEYLKVAKKTTGTDYFEFGKKIFDPIVRKILNKDSDAVIPKEKFMTRTIAGNYEWQTPQFNDVCWENIKKDANNVVTRWTDGDNESDKIEHSFGAIRFNHNDNSSVWLHDRLLRVLETMKNNEDIPFVKLFNGGGSVLKSLNLDEIFSATSEGYRNIAYWIAQAMWPETPIANLTDKIELFKSYWNLSS